jgi:carbon monoxide dehydrogenase subunit G
MTIVQLEGMIQTNCPPDRVVALLADPAALGRVAPQGCQFGAVEGNTIPFMIKRNIGLLNLSLSGRMTLTRKADGVTYLLALEAAHRIGGGVDADLDLTPMLDAGGDNRLTWNGTLRSHGLMARLILDQAGVAETVVKTMFQRLRHLAEDQPNAATPATPG